jgi:hypothetical protein
MKIEIIIALIIAAYLNSHMDKVSHGKIKDTVWLGDKNWFIKYPISFLSTRWHFEKSLIVAMALFVFTQDIVLTAIYYTVFGIFFNIFYHR